MLQNETVVADGGRLMFQGEGAGAVYEKTCTSMVGRDEDC